MMGFGQAGMMSVSWIGGLLAIALVWGGVWLLLSIIGAAPRRGPAHPAPRGALPHTGTWQQPDFTTPPTDQEAESEAEVVRNGDERR